MGASSIGVNRVQNGIVGGAAAVTCYYDIYTNLLVGGVGGTQVLVWNDVKPGKLPLSSSINSGSLPPIYEANNIAIHAQTASMNLTSGPGTTGSLNLSGTWGLVWWGTVSGAAASAHCVEIADSIIENQYISVCAGSTFVMARGSQNDFNVIMSQSNGGVLSTGHTFIASISGGVMYGDAPNQTRITEGVGAGGNNASANGALTVFQRWGGTGPSGINPTVGYVRGVMLINHVPTAGDVTWLGFVGASRYGFAHL